VHKTWMLLARIVLPLPSHLLDFYWRFVALKDRVHYFSLIPKTYTLIPKNDVTDPKARLL